MVTELYVDRHTRNYVEIPENSQIFFLITKKGKNRSDLKLQASPKNGAQEKGISSSAVHNYHMPTRLLREMNAVILNCKVKSINSAFYILLLQ
jgi:hypothetical protein